MEREDAATRCWGLEQKWGALRAPLPWSPPSSSDKVTAACPHPRTPRCGHTHVIQTQTYTHVDPGTLIDTLQVTGLRAGGAWGSGLMEQKAPDFLSTCFPPQPTHFPPAHTTHRWEPLPPKKCLSLILTEWPWGFSSCSHFCPLSTNEERNWRLRARTRLVKGMRGPGGGGMQTQAHCTDSKSMAFPELLTPVPLPHLPMPTHPLPPRKSLEVQAMGGSQPSLPPRLLWIP